MVSASASPSLSDIEMAFTPFPPIEAASAAGGAPAPPPPPTKNHFVSQTLGNNMVLQRAPAQAVLWGFAGTGGTVTVTMDSAPPLAAVTDAQGFWRATLPATEASNDPHTPSGLRMAHPPRSLMCSLGMFTFAVGNPIWPSRSPPTPTRQKKLRKESTTQLFE